MSDFQSLDSLTLRAYVAELRPLIEGGFLQKFSQLSEFDYRLNLRLPASVRESREIDSGAQRQLHVRLLPGKARLLLVPPGGDSVQAMPPKGFAMLVRKFAQGRPLARLRQLELDRVVEFQFHGQSSVRLVIELSDRHPNLLLVREEDNKILGAHRLGNVGERFLRPGLVYTLPPRPELPSGDQLPPGFLEGLSEEPLARALSSNLFGLPLDGARELVQRAGLDPMRPAAGQELGRLEAVWPVFFAELDAGQVHPGLTPEGKLVAFRGPKDRPFQSLLAAESAAESGQAEGPRVDRLAGVAVARRDLEQKLRKARLRLTKQQEELRSDLKRVDQVESLQKTADLLMFHKDQLRPTSSGEVVQLPGWEPDEVVEYKLEPGVSPRQAAQQLYKKASKYRRSVPILSARLELLRAQEVEVSEWAATLNGLQDPQLVAELAARVEPLLGSKLRSQPVKPTTEEGPRQFRLQGFLVLVGRNPKQNERLTFQMAARDDLWLHTRDFPGSHVIVKLAGRLAEPEVLEAAAVLAARHSRGAEETRVTVVCTTVQRVRRVSGGPSGKVLYEDEMTLIVDPRAAIEGLIKVV